MLQKQGDCWSLDLALWPFCLNNMSFGTRSGFFPHRPPNPGLRGLPARAQPPAAQPAFTQMLGSGSRTSISYSTSVKVAGARGPDCEDGGGLAASGVSSRVSNACLTACLLLGEGEEPEG